MDQRETHGNAVVAPQRAATLALPRFELPPPPSLRRPAHPIQSTPTPAPSSDLPPLAPAARPGHSHTHGNAPCAGHGNAPAPVAVAAPAPHGHAHAHSHAHAHAHAHSPAAPAPVLTPTPVAAPAPAAKRAAHGHSHGGTPCSGHGHAHAAAKPHTPSPPNAHSHAQAHAHSHAGGSCDGGHGLFDAHTHDWSHLAMQPRSKRMLKWALYVQGAFLLFEVVGGIITNSLALLGDAAHMLADVGALALALLAAQLAARAIDSRRTWGMPRAEMLAAAFNSFTLVVSCVWIAYEAVHRMFVPEGIDGTGLMGIAFAGLLANVAGAYILSKADADNVNIRAAMLHLLVDAASSVGVIIAGLVISMGGPVLVDTIASLLIALLAVKGTWPVLTQSLNSLLDAAPAGVTAEDIVRVLGAAPGVTQVHDVHVWEPGPRRIAATAHVLVRPGADIGNAIVDLRGKLAAELGVDHVTLQVATDRSAERFGVERIMLRDHAVERAIDMVRAARPSADPERVRAAVHSRAAHVQPSGHASPVRLLSGALRDLA